MRFRPMTELTAYRDFVADALVRSLDLPEGVIFGNSTAEHARVVMDTIIDNARNELKLMARALSSEVHDPYHLQKALQNSKDLGVQVIVEVADPFTCGNSALSALTNDVDARTRIEVRQLKQPSVTHLAVADGTLARIEQDQTERRAIIVFNNEELAGQALRRFNEIWSGCTPIPWP